MFSLTNQQQRLRYIIQLVILLLCFVFAFNFALSFLFLSFVVAYVLGSALMFFDEKYFYRFYREDADSKSILMTRNPLFLFCLPFLSIFVLTSTGSLIGVALVLAINTVLCTELLLLSADYQQLNQRFNLRLHKKLDAQQTLLLRLAILIYFLLIFINCF